MWTRTGLVCLLMAAPLLAGQVPNFTGRWKLNEARTQGGNHRRTVFVIEHKEPAFRYSASGNLKLGAPFSEAYEFTTDGKTPRVAGRAQVVGHWEGSTLVMEYVKGETPLMTFRFRLSANGKEMLREAESKDGRRIREVYDRQ